MEVALVVEIKPLHNNMMIEWNASGVVGNSMIPLQKGICLSVRKNIRKLRSRLRVRPQDQQLLTKEQPLLDSGNNEHQLLIKN